MSSAVLRVRSLPLAIAVCASASQAELRLDSDSEVLVALSPELRVRKAGGGTKIVREINEAATDLAAYLSKICGASATVSGQRPGFRGTTVHIGLTDLVRKQALELEDLDLEGFLIRTVGPDVVLVGRTHLGTRHAIYTFLERYCGVRWYFPGKLGTYVPRMKALVLPEIHQRMEPAFRARYFTIHGSEDARQWERRNRLQDHWNVRLKGNSHSMAGVIPTSVYGVEHPEYFAWREGKREVPQSAARERRAAYCLTNPEVIELCVRWVTAYFDKRPSATCVSMAMNDTSRYCQCERCKSEGVRGAADGPNYADRYFSFVNRVARKVRPKHPDKFIGVLAYGGASVLPNRLKTIEDNVNVYLVGASPAYDFIPGYRERARELVRGWASFAESLCVYTHQFGTAESRFLQIPAFYPQLVEDQLRFLHQTGVKGTVIEMLPFWAFSPRPWLMAKMLWDPSRSADELLDDFCTRMFGPAASEMRSYFALLEEAWVSQKRIRKISSYDTQYEVVRPYLARIDDLLGKALQKAPQESEKARVRFFADGIRATQLFAQSCEYASAFMPFPATGQEVFDTLRGVRRLYENEAEIEGHRDALEQKYGIAREVIAPRDKTEVLRETVEQCAGWLEARGFREEAGLLRNSPAASLGGLSKAAQARARAALQEEAKEALTGVGKEADDEEPDDDEIGLEDDPEAGETEEEGPKVVPDALEQVLKKEGVILAALKPEDRSAAPAADLARYVDRFEVALRGGAKLLIRESFESGERIGRNGGEVRGAVRFEPGVSGQAVYAHARDSVIAYPIEKVNHRAGTIEFFLKTRWAGRKGELRVPLVCTGGNYDPPGHLSISVAGDGKTRSLRLALYFVKGVAYTSIPLKDWHENAWHHVAAMWRIDPEHPEANHLTLYLNGKPSQSQHNLKDGREVHFTGPLGIGNRPVSQAFMQNPLAVFDELRVYDRPIPPEALSFACVGGAD